MKVEELMLGDWVEFNNPKDGDEFIKVGLRTLFNMTDSEYLCSYIQPIPITPEILEKNGFVNYNDLNCYYIHEGEKQWCDSIFQRLEDGRYQLEVFGHGSICKIVSETIYVHELQHAILMCKIDKEIEL